MYKLMIVDDSNIIRNRIERCFNSSQFKSITTAKDGLEAIDKFKQFKPELVTMDLTMPNVDGLECIQKIYSIDPTVGILVVSALSDKMTGLLALEYGAQGFICKPFTDEQLVVALDKIALNRLKNK